MDIKDLLFFALVSLTAGLLANHYFNLDIGFLNSIESSLISSGQGGKSALNSSDGGRGAEDPKSNTAECKNLMKSHADRKMLARSDIATAKKAGDTAKAREIEAMLEALAREERAVCK